MLIPVMWVGLSWIAGTLITDTGSHGVWYELYYD